MIRTDGARAIQRKPLVKKMLANILDMDLPAKTIILDGFRLNAWQQGEDLNGGSVVSPPGVIAICSRGDEIVLCLAESMTGGFFPSRKLSIFDAGVEHGQASVIYIPDPEVDTNAANKIVYQSNHPLRLRRCQCVAVPIKSAEAVFLAVSVESGSDHYSAEYGINYYSWVGGQAQRSSVGWEQVDGDMAGRVIHLLPGAVFRAVSTTPFIHAPIDGTDIPRALAINEVWQIDNTQTVQRRVIPSSVIWAALPELLYNLVGAYHEEAYQAISLADYAYSSSDGSMTILDMAHTRMAADDAPRPNFFWSSTGEISESRRWGVFYTLYTEDADGIYSVTTVDATKILPTLHMISHKPILYDGPINTPWTDDFDINNSAMGINWDRALVILQALIPSSGVLLYTPHDSIAFHGPGGIYAWSRQFAAVHFSTTGLLPVDLNIPNAAIDEDGVQPLITYAGDSVWLCVCRRRSGDVVAIHYGSPFGAWNAVVLPVDNILVHVRPITVSNDAVILIGVARYTYEGGDEPQEIYRMAILSWVVDNPEPPQWSMLAAIPVEQSDDAEWNLTLFGNHGFVNGMAQYPTQPIAMSQSVSAADYNEYIDYYDIF